MNGNDQPRHKAKRSFGQNFLADQEVIEKIAAALDLNKADTIIEIGAGNGALTAELLGRAGSVVAIELDRDLIPSLRSRFDGIDNLTIIETDILDLDLQTIIRKDPEGEKTKLVGNLPYNISTAILQRLIAQRSLFSTIVLMFQREVVERIAAEPGNSDRGYLTILVEAAFERENLFDVPPTAFLPKPKVWSSIVRLMPKKPSFADEDGFRRFLSIAFAQKRKTLANNLKALFPDAVSKIESCSIDPKRRAETLTLDEWDDLYGAFSTKKRPLVNDNERP